jgi:hypothetical protein
VLSICFKRKKERWQISEERTKIIQQMTIKEEKEQLDKMIIELNNHRKNCKQCNLPVRDEFEEAENACHINEGLQDDVGRLDYYIKQSEYAFNKELKSRGYKISDNEIIRL